MIIVDLFAGAGGWDVALRNLGAPSTEIQGFEMWDRANATAEAAGFGPRYQVDISRFPVAPCDLLVASPPCQSFSNAGKRKGASDVPAILSVIEGATGDNIDDRLNWLRKVVTDPRSALVLEPLRWVLVARPTFVAWEQVPSVKVIWGACAETLRGLGYSVAVDTLQAEQYGVPQTRRRAILVARRDGVPVELPTPTHSKYYPRSPEKLDSCVAPWVSMLDALRNSQPSPTITDCGMSTGGAEPIAHWSRYYGALQMNQKPDGDLYKWVAGSPAPTIVGSFSPDVVSARGCHTVSRQKVPGSVRVTVEEAGILQSFPGDYPWQGTKADKFLQVGNAIPPLLAEAVLRQFFVTQFTPGLLGATVETC